MFRFDVFEGVHDLPEPEPVAKTSYESDTTVSKTISECDSLTMTEWFNDLRGSDYDSEEELSAWESGDQEAVEVVCTSESTAVNLRRWALAFNINHAALKSLLAVIHNDRSGDTSWRSLPSDPRTLLETPRERAEIVNIKGGQYWHNGLAKCLESYFRYVKC